MSSLTLIFHCRRWRCCDRISQVLAVLAVRFASAASRHPSSRPRELIPMTGSRMGRRPSSPQRTSPRVSGGARRVSATKRLSENTCIVEVGRRTGRVTWGARLAPRAIDIVQRVDAVFFDEVRSEEALRLLRNTAGVVMKSGSKYGTAKMSAIRHP